jgi:glycosyltransferase involved in cell wall biosynthesis
VKVTVLNAGVHPELQQAAVALAHERYLTRYVTTLGWSADTSIWGGPAGILGRHRFLQRRMHSLAQHEVHRRAIAFEVLHQALRRIPGVSSRRLIETRNLAFELSVQCRQGPPGDMIIAQQDNALVAFSNCSDDALRVLNASTVHPRTLGSVIDREVRRYPHLRDSLEKERLLPRVLARREREIDLADCVLVASTYAKKTFVDEGVDPQKLIVVPLGCDMHALRTDEPAIIRSPEARPSRFLFLGRTSHLKGLTYLVEAFKDMLETGLDSTLTIVGGHPGEDLEFLPSVVRCQGWVPKSAVPQLFLEHDVLVMPTLLDGFGLTAVEAMSHGLPVIASNCSVATDVIRSGVNGFVVAAADANALLNAMMHYATMGHAAQVSMRNDAWRAGNEYTWARYQRVLLEELSTLTADAFPA